MDRFTSPTFGILLSRIQYTPGCWPQLALVDHTTDTRGGTKKHVQSEQKAMVPRQHELQIDDWIQLDDIGDFYPT